MKNISFSNEVLNSHLKDLENVNDRDYFDKKLKSIYSWLHWMKDKGSISEKQYLGAYRKVKEIELAKFSKTTTNDISHLKGDKLKKNPFGFFLSYKSITLLIITFLFLFNIYIYNLYSALSKEIVIKNNQGRVLPFKGSIKETDGKALDTKRDVVFHLYNVSQGGSPVYTGKCLGEAGLEPQYNGSFTILIGSDCGMEPIPENLFQQNSTLYLGMTIGSEEELQPRYQIFTTTYSKDTSKLQGFELGKTTSSIPFIDETGMIQLDSESPIVKSTNGTFSIEGKTLSLKAEDSTEGNIIIQPGSESNVIIPFGKLGLGTFQPESIFDISGTQLFTSTASIKNLAIPDDENTSTLRLSLGTELKGVKSNFIEFFAGTTSEDPGKKVGDIRINNDGVVYETANADFAEYFTLASNEQIPVGTIVSISSKGIHSSVLNEKIIGAVSSRAGFIGNKKDPKINAVLIALVGQVHVLVSTINGEIQIGDKIGSTMIPGFGGIVGQIDHSVGYSLEKTADDNFVNEKCPKSYKNRRDRSGKKIRCGTLKILLDLE